MSSALGDAPRRDKQSVRPPELRHLHPLTPLFGSWRLLGLASALGYGVLQNDLDRVRWIWDALQGHAQLSVAAEAAGVLLAVVGVSLVAGWLSWRVTWFAITAEPGSAGTLLYHRGLLVRQRRQVRLNRVQSVDVNQPFVPRLFGLAAVRLDMAAGSESSVNLAYLRLGEAWRLREQVLRHPTPATSADRRVADAAAGPNDAAGNQDAGTGVNGPSSTAGAGPDRLVARISTTKLIQANALDGIGTVVVAVAWVAGSVVVEVVWGWQAFFGALALVAVVVADVVRRVRTLVGSVLRDADFTLVRTAAGIRTSSGLTSTVNRTVALDRIQGVRLEEPFLWRRFGWARVMVDIAGADKPPAGRKAGAALMPVADRGEALRFVAEVTGARLESEPSVGQGARSQTLDPWGFRFGGVVLLHQGAVTRWGRLSRHQFFVPYARVQSVQAHQGWLQRRLRLATVYLDPPLGVQRWRAKHRDEADAVSLLGELALQARQHRLPSGAQVASDVSDAAGDATPAGST